MMKSRQVTPVLARISVAVLAAGLSWIGWLAILIPTFKVGNSLLTGLGWLTAPVAVGAGFAVGCLVGERLTCIRRSRFPRLFAWFLLASTVGAGAMIWFGPMLIVFGMFLVGTAGMVWREVFPGVAAVEFGRKLD